MNKTEKKLTYQQQAMGILNLTDNSFYDGNKYNTIEKAVKRRKND